jgi:RNA polymerase sigma factor (TIGR02999 family)
MAVPIPAPHAGGSALECMAAMVEADDGDGEATTDPITSWVGAARAGDRQAEERLYRAVYEELRRIAHAQRRRLAPTETLSTTVLVHELYLKLARSATLEVADRHHFYSLAARVARQILIDGARRESAARRGGDVALESLVGGREAIAPQRPEELLALDEALERLAAIDPELAAVVEVHFFGGLSFEEMAAMSSKSDRTLRREWRRARAFLYQCLGAGR